MDRLMRNFWTFEEEQKIFGTFEEVNEETENSETNKYQTNQQQKQKNLDLPSKSQNEVLNRWSKTGQQAK